jgi:lauroyl/myristoyl acyltransferase
MDLPGSTEPRGSVLYEARSRLLDGGTILITADGPSGRDAFQVKLPGGTAVVRSGWFALRRLTSAPTLPVLVHQEGRHQVITIHPALPSVTPNSGDDLDRCREVITPLLERFVREHPEQCYTLTFPSGG